MPVNPASRLANIAPFHVMELLARARQLEQQGRDIIHMEVGEPDFPTPQPIIAAAQQHIASGRVFYTPALGLPELRGAIADFYAARYGVNVPSSRVVVTSGASAALLLALACLVEPGSEADRIRELDAHGLDRARRYRFGQTSGEAGGVQ